MDDSSASPADARRINKLLTGVLWGLAVIALVAFVGLAPWRDRPAPAGSEATAAGFAGDVPAEVAEEPVDATGLPVLWDAPDFALTDATGSSFGAADLRGDVYALSFFFTECTGACPMITEQMAGLQRSVPDDRVKLVSITVDPVNDTAGALSTYAEKVGAADRWHFLTGTPEQVSAVAAGFRLPFEDPTQHAVKILLVDAQGRVRGHYPRDPSAADALAADARALAAVAASGDPMPVAAR